MLNTVLKVISVAGIVIKFSLGVIGLVEEYNSNYGFDLSEYID